MDTLLLVQDVPEPLLLVEEAPEPLSARCLESDRDSISPRFSVRPAGACFITPPDVEELLRNVEVACNGYES